MTQDNLDRFQSSLTGFDVTLDRPDDPGGEAWIDVSLGNFSTNVSYRPTIGFGIFLEAPQYGQRPDEVHADPLRAAKRVRQLLQSFKEAGVIAPLDLGSLRELFDVTQEELAVALGIKQPSVQRLEKRANVKFDTLRSHVAALGGRIETRVVFPDLDARFELPTTVEELIRPLAVAAWPTPPLPMSLEMLVLRAKDPHHLATFYECLGAAFSDEKHGKGAAHKSAKLGETVFEIYPCVAGQQASNTRVGFKVASIADALKRLEPHLSHPAKCQQSELGQFWIVQDPEGNQVHLSEASVGL